MASSYTSQSLFSNDITSTLSTWAGNLQRNTTQAFADLEPKNKIRLIVIVCAYLLIRPYLAKLGAKQQMRQLIEEGDRTEEARARIDANDMRGAKAAIPGVDEEDEERDEAEARSSASNWGARAKLRQRAMIRRKMEEHEARLKEVQDTDSDADIADLLEE